MNEKGDELLYIKTYLRHMILVVEERATWDAFQPKHKK